MPIYPQRMLREQIGIDAMVLTGGDIHVASAENAFRVRARVDGGHRGTRCGAGRAGYHLDESLGHYL